MKPVLFATGHLPEYRVGAFAALHEREGIEVALFGGRLRHGGAQARGEMPFPCTHVSQSALFALASARRHRALVISTAGRLAPLAGWAGARRAGIPLVLWTSLWAHPRTPAHALSYVALRRLYRSADALVTYGPHVSAYVRARGARNVFVAAQSVDNDFWRAPPGGEPGPALPPGGPRFLFVGRPAHEKGVATLLDAWLRARLAPRGAVLVLAGVGESYAPAGRALPGGVLALDALDPQRLRDLYAACDVLVLPSLRTRTFREPWGLVVNEAMNRSLPVIASDAVGAAAGGLVRDGRNGLIVPAGDAAALAAALSRLASDPQLRARMGSAGSEDVLAYDHAAWAEGFSAALAVAGVSRARC